MRSVVCIVAGVLALAGCDNLLAKNNPCGGIYPADGVAQVSAQTHGDLADEGTTYAFELTKGTSQESGPDGACWTLVSGTATDKGGETTDLNVSCGRVGLDVTLPDLRAVAEGAVVQVPVTVESSPNNAPLCQATATLTITRAVGGKSPAPSFVTSDFQRVATLDFDSSSAASGTDNDAGDGGVHAGQGGDAGDAGSTGVNGCPANITLHAQVEMNAGDYTQGMTSGEDHCPALPAR